MIFYAAIAAFGVILLLVMLLVGELFGGDHDISHDVASGHDVDSGGPSIFSTRIMAAFLTAFGVGGIVARYYGLSHPAASGVGVVCGVVMSAIVYQFAKILYSQQASSEVQMTRPRRDDGRGVGRDSGGRRGPDLVAAGGERTEHIARSADGAAIARGAEVRHHGSAATRSSWRRSSPARRGGPMNVLSQ